MMKKPFPEAMIFDMDGTLFQTESLIAAAYHETFDQLKREGLYEGEHPPIERMLSSLGMLLEHIWENVLPGSDKRWKDRANEIFLERQMIGLRQGQGHLYPGVKDTLEELARRGIRLFVASNGLEAYIREIVHQRGLSDYFDGLYSAGEYQTVRKVELVRLLLTHHPFKGDVWMVGDRSSDVEAGKENGLRVIGCAYAGFQQGDELKDADVRIRTFPELLQWL